MTPIKIAMSALLLSASLSTTAVCEKLNTNPAQPAGPIADVSGRVKAATTTSDRSGQGGTSVSDADADSRRLARLADGFFLSFGGLTWEGLAAQARWSEAYIAGTVGTYNRQRYNSCLEFLAFYYELIRQTALIDVELEVYLKDIGILPASSNDPENGVFERPDREVIDTNDVSIPNGEA